MKSFFIMTFLIFSFSSSVSAYQFESLKNFGLDIQIDRETSGGPYIKGTASKTYVDGYSEFESCEEAKRDSINNAAKVCEIAGFTSGFIGKIALVEFEGCKTSRVLIKKQTSAIMRFGCK